MGQIKVVVQDHTLAKRSNVELPDNVEMKRLIPALVTKLNLPAMQGGNPINYQMDHKRTGKRLAAEDTLASAGVQPDDTLTMLPAPTAGKCFMS